MPDTDFGIFRLLTLGFLDDIFWNILDWRFEMIKREASETLKRLSEQFPVVAITGPRKSGKTTLALPVELE